MSWRTFWPLIWHQSAPGGMNSFFIRNGISRAAETLRGLDWFEVTEIRGHLDDGAIAHVQVGLKVGFRLDGSDSVG